MSVNQPPGFVKRQDHHKDAFLGGKLSVFQPDTGFRAGLDSVLLGAGVPPGAGSVLDLGAGVGVGALCALAHNGQLAATLVEIDPQMADLARRNIDHNGFAGRARVIEIDATARGADRTAAGLATDRYDVVIANPPFFASGTRAPDAARSMARHARGDIGEWVRTAVSSAHAKGVVIFIHMAQALPDLLGAFDARMGAITVLPIASRPGLPAHRVLVRGRKDSRAPMQLLAPLVVHGETGPGFSPAVEMMLRGNAVLDW